MAVNFPTDLQLKLLCVFVLFYVIYYVVCNREADSLNYVLKYFDPNMQETAFI